VPQVRLGPIVRSRARRALKVYKVFREALGPLDPMAPPGPRDQRVLIPLLLVRRAEMA